MFVLYLIAGAIVLYFIGGCVKMHRLNKDISQRQLAGLFSGVGNGDLDSSDIAAFLALHGWGEKEALRRIAHALTLAQRISTPLQYEIAHRIAMEVSRNYLPLMASFQAHMAKIR